MRRRGRHAQHADLQQYATSKLMELMAAEELNRRLHVSGHRRTISVNRLAAACDCLYGWET